MSRPDRLDVGCHPSPAEKSPILADKVVQPVNSLVMVGGGDRRVTVSFVVSSAGRAPPDAIPEWDGPDTAFPETTSLPVRRRSAAEKCRLHPPLAQRDGPQEVVPH